MNPEVEHSGFTCQFCEPGADLTLSNLLDPLHPHASAIRFAPTSECLQQTTVLMAASNDLRNALQYVRRFRDEVFVISIDGAVVAHENFNNVLMDIAALHSLGIHVVVVHGIAWQLTRLAEQRKVNLSDVDGTKPVDRSTLALARWCASSVSQGILDGLFTTHQTRGAIPNAIKAKPKGLIAGQDFLLSGRVDRLDVEYMKILLEHGIVPVIPPLATDAGGEAYRLNSDEVAEQIASSLNAIKLIYVTCDDGVVLRESPVRHLSTEATTELLAAHRDSFSPGILSKLEHALAACRGKVSRAHIIDGRRDECILDEVFSNEGIGTMIHANDYENIRPAQQSDVNFIWELVRIGIEKDQLVERSRHGIHESIEDFVVFEIDGAVLGCVSLHVHDDRSGEIAALHVSPSHMNQSIGTRLVRYIEESARRRGISTLFCLSTQAYSFFQQKLDYSEVDWTTLPDARKARYEASGRRSKVLRKQI